MKTQILALTSTLLLTLSAQAFPVGTFKCIDNSNKSVSAEISFSKVPGMDLPLVSYKRFFQEATGENNLQRETTGLGTITTDNYFKRDYVSLGNVRFDFDASNITALSDMIGSPCVRAQ